MLNNQKYNLNVNKVIKLFLLFVLILIFLIQDLSAFCQFECIGIKNQKKNNPILTARVQEILRDLGYMDQNVNVADGVFGVKTRDAVIEFQKKYNLKQDGIVGQATIDKMREVYKDNPVVRSDINEEFKSILRDKYEKNLNINNQPSETEILSETHSSPTFQDDSRITMAENLSAKSLDAEFPTKIKNGNSEAQEFRNGRENNNYQPTDMTVRIPSSKFIAQNENKTDNGNENNNVLTGKTSAGGDIYTDASGKESYKYDSVSALVQDGATFAAKRLWEKMKEVTTGEISPENLKSLSDNDLQKKFNENNQRLQDCSERLWCISEDTYRDNENKIRQEMARRNDDPRREAELRELSTEDLQNLSAGSNNPSFKEVADRILAEREKNGDPKNGGEIKDSGVYLICEQPKGEEEIRCQERKVYAAKRCIEEKCVDIIRDDEISNGDKTVVRPGSENYASQNFANKMILINPSVLEKTGAGKYKFIGGGAGQENFEKNSKDIKEGDLLENDPNIYIKKCNGGSC